MVRVDNWSIRGWEGVVGWEGEAIGASRGVGSWEVSD